MLSVVHDSKYGEYTWTGRAVAALAGAATARVARSVAAVRTRSERETRRAGI
jgi:hypothetical protein